MKNFILSMVVFLISLNYHQALSQIFSEAPVEMMDGVRLSDMIYVKFKNHDMISIPQGENYVSAENLSRDYTEIRNIISEFCEARQLKLEDVSIRKAIPRANAEDTLFVDLNTGEIKKLPDLSRVYIFLFPKLVDIESLIIQLENDPWVEYSHGPVQWVNCIEYSPNDSYYQSGSQWYLDAIDAPEAWQISRNNTDIKIALIEGGGVELTHEDLAANIAGGDGNPNGVNEGHGTGVAGFAGAVTNNQTGIASLSWNVGLLTYQPYNDDEYRTVLAQKIYDAVADGADVINMSFRTIKGGLPNCPDARNSSENIKVYTYYLNWSYDLVQEACSTASSQNVILIAAAGNTSSPIGYDDPCEDIPYPCYPAQYQGVIGVSGSYQNGYFVDNWNYGSNLVDVNAPGKTSPALNDGLLTTWQYNSYTSDNGGTSFSAPQVAALAAMIKSFNPSISPSEVEQILESTADKIGQYPYSNGKNAYMGYGRINAFDAVLEAEHGKWYYAYQNKSLNDNATYSNSSRHIAQTEDYLHEIFSSDNELFYRRKNLNTGQWIDTKKVTTDQQAGENKNACIICCNGVIHVVWECKTGPYEYQVWYCRSDEGNIDWEYYKRLATVTISSSQYGAMPVISFLHDESQLIVVYCEQQGLWYRRSNTYGVTWLSAAQIVNRYDIGYPSITHSANKLYLAYNYRDAIGVALNEL